jgi:hypothetical protein
MQPHFEHQLEPARRLYNNDTYLRCSKSLLFSSNRFAVRVQDCLS